MTSEHEALVGRTAVERAQADVFYAIQIDIEDGAEEASPAVLAAFGRLQEAIRSQMDDDIRRLVEAARRHHREECCYCCATDYLEFDAALEPFKAVSSTAVSEEVER